MKMRIPFSFETCFPIIGKQVLLYVLVFLNLSTSAYSQKVGISGWIKCACLKEDIEMSDIIIQPYDKLEQSRTYHFESGKFSIELTPGIYKVIVASPHHNPVELPLLYLRDTNDYFEVYMEHYPYLDTIVNVRVAGDFNDNSYQMSYMMTMRYDGKLTFSSPTKKDTVRYQLAGLLTTPNRAIHGTDYDYLTVDDIGDYYAHKAVSGDFRITLDPSRLVRCKEIGRQSFLNPQSQKIHNILTDYNNDKAYIEELAKDQSGKHEMIRSKVISVITKISQDLQHAEDSRLKEVLYVLYLHSTISGIHLNVQLADSNILKNMFRDVPYDSPIWSLYNPGLMVFANMQIPSQPVPSQYLIYAYTYHPDTNVRTKVLYNIIDYAHYNGTPEIGKEAYKILLSKYPNTKDAKDAKERYYKDRIATAAPEFSVKRAFTSELITRATLKGTYTLIDFWAVWCGPCIAEMSNLHKLSDEYRGKSFQILSVSLDKKEVDIENFRSKRWKMPWLHAWAEGGFESEIAKKFNVLELPAPFLVDPDGNIVARGNDLRGELLFHTIKQFIQ